MADFVLKYADGRGQIHQQVATAASEMVAATSEMATATSEMAAATTAEMAATTVATTPSTVTTTASSTMCERGGRRERQSTHQNQTDQ